MHYKQTMRKLRAMFGSNPILYEYFKKWVKKPPRTKLGYWIRQFISFLFL